MKKIFKLLICFICALLLWELILQATIIKMPPPYNHPVLGKINAGGRYLYAREGFSVTYINSLGMRHEEISNKVQDEQRLLFLGDSFTEAIQVQDNKTFCEVLSKKLNINNVTVINAGRSGASPAYYIHLAEFYQKKVEPDYVIIQLNEDDFTTDIMNKNRYFYVAKNGDSYETLKDENILSTNTIARKFGRLYYFSRFSTIRIGAEKIFRLLGDRNEDAESKNIDSPTIDENLVSWVMSRLKNSYLNVVVIYLPTVGYKNTQSSSTELENKLSLYAQEYDLDFINMRKDFVNYYRSNIQPIAGFNNRVPGAGHLNEIGHKLIADRLYKYFQGRLNL